MQTDSERKIGKICESTWRDERWNVGQVQSHFLAVPHVIGMDFFMLGVC